MGGCCKLLLAGCITSQLVYLRDGSARCHVEIEVADQTFYLGKSQHADAEPTSPSFNPLTARRLAGQPLTHPFLSHWYDLEQDPPRLRESTPDLQRSKRTP